MSNDSLRPKRPNEKPWWFPGYPSLREVTASGIAVGVVGFAMAALWGPLKGASPETVAAIVGPLLGSVLGYYFGTASGERVARQANERADEAVAERREVAGDSAERLETAEQLLAEQRELLARVRPYLPLVEDGEEGHGDEEDDGNKAITEDDSQGGS